MIKVYSECDTMGRFNGFKPWGDAKEVYDCIVEAGMVDEVWTFIEDLFSDQEYVCDENINTFLEEDKELHEKILERLKEQGKTLDDVLHFRWDEQW